MLRAAALAALVFLIWRTARPAESPATVASTRGGLERTLVDATRRPVTALALDLDSVPGRVHRDWLAAVRAAGTSVAWSAPDLQAIAIATSVVAEPESRVRVVVAGSDNSPTVVVSDELGAIDTIQARASPSSRLLRTARGSLSASTPGVHAVAQLPVPVQVRRVLVIASAGWESKFVVGALEEAGWIVDARIRVAPGVETRQGADFALDTARYSAVVALDGTAASNASAIERYVSSGGGAILAGAVTRLPAFARITPGAASSRRLAEPQPGLVLGGVRSDAVVLDTQAGEPMVAARRSGRGRVVASGYDETWKWRMRRAAEAPAAHREWWTALVSAVAYVPPIVARDSAGISDPAPVAALTAVLGPPSELDRAASGARSRMPPVWLLFGVLLASLLGEVVSRRYRGLA